MPKKFESHKFSFYNLNNDSPEFTFNIKPYPDELLSSWITRLSEANFCSFSYFLNNFYRNELELLQKDVKKPQFTNFDIDINPLDEIITILSEKSGINSQEIEKMAVNTGSIDLPKEFYFKNTSKKYCTLRYCPLCLQEYPYFRKKWKFAFITHCEKHHIYLNNKCPNPNCGKNIVLSKKQSDEPITNCVYCGWDLSKSEIHDISKNDNNDYVSRKLIGILEKNEWSASNLELFTTSDYFDEK